MTDTKVYLLDGGTMVMDGYHAFWNRGPGGEIRFPCYSVLVEHRDGRFLFDTGFDCDHVARRLAFSKPLQTADQTIPGQLALLGLRPRDIGTVVNSHLHFDHCGGNIFFDEATTICHAREIEALAAPHSFEANAYSDVAFVPDIATRGGDAAPPALEDLSIQTITGDQEIAKGLHLFETPGHSAGHYSLLVELPHRRPMLFSFDACNSRRHLDLMVISSFHLDPVANVASMERLKSLAAHHDAELFFSHDPENYGSYRKAPGFYA